MTTDNLNPTDKVIQALEAEINKTPTGELRNLLCDINIMLRQQPTQEPESKHKQICKTCLNYDGSGWCIKNKIHIGEQQVCPDWFHEPESKEGKTKQAAKDFLDSYGCGSGTNYYTEFVAGLITEFASQQTAPLLKTISELRESERLLKDAMRDSLNEKDGRISGLEKENGKLRIDAEKFRALQNALDEVLKTDTPDDIKNMNRKGMSWEDLNRPMDI